MFDAVGTLMHPQPGVAEVYASAGRRFGSRLTADEIHPRFQAAWAAAPQSLETSEARERARWRSVVAHVFQDAVPAAALDALFSELWDHFAQGPYWELFPDVLPACQKLEQRGYLLGVASNFDGRLLQVLARWPLLAHCPRVFYSSQLGYAKPDPRFFTAICERLSTSPGEMLLVGDDAEIDIAAARSAGWQAVQIARNAQHDAQILNDLRDLDRWLTG
jgi:putative hydrolase of the HAD superfamily